MRWSAIPSRASLPLGDVAGVEPVRAEGRFVVAKRRVEERRVLLCEPPAHTLQRFYSE